MTLIILLFFTTTTTTFAQVVYNDGDRRDVIRLSNTLKCMHQQDYNEWYKYSPCIENYSLKHAQWMATNNKFQHSSNPYGDRTCYSDRGLGENIAAGHRTAQSAINAFYFNEIGNVNWDNPSDSSKGVVGHLTALVWRSNRHLAAAGAYDANSSYKYFWSQNLAAPGGTNPNTSGRYVENVPRPTRNYTVCEKMVWQYYNQYPSQYWASGSGMDGFTQISQVTINGEFNTPLSRGQTVTVAWAASNNDNQFSVFLYDIGGSSYHVKESKKFTLATNLSGSQRSAVVTIPDTIQASEYGILCVQTTDSDQSEMSCAAGLQMKAQNTPAPTSWSWRTGAFGQCEDRVHLQACGKMVRRRAVDCIDNFGNIADKSKCSGPQPSTDEECDLKGNCENGGKCDYSTFHCICPENTDGAWCEHLITPTTYSWRTGEFGQCEDRVHLQACGKMIRRRAVDCIADNTGQVVDRSKCSEPQPSTDEECDLKGNCENGGKCDYSTFHCVCPENTTGAWCEHIVTPTTYSWRTGEFGQCEDRVHLQACGKMVRRRPVDCIDSGSGQVVDRSKCTADQPNTDEECDLKGNCENGGKCDYSTFHCICPENTAGAWCEHSITPTGYKWRVGNFGSCENRVNGQTCGTLVRRRPVDCVDKNNKVTSDRSKCGNVPQPHTDEECDVNKGNCLNGGSCQTTSTWQCTCPRTHRGTWCERRTGFASPTTPTSSSTSPSSQHTPDASSPIYEWLIGPFTECHPRVVNQTCGQSIRTRSIQCVDISNADNKNHTVVDSALCGDAIPITEEPCEMIGVCRNGGICQDEHYMQTFAMDNSTTTPVDGSDTNNSTSTIDDTTDSSHNDNGNNNNNNNTTPAQPSYTCSCPDAWIGNLCELPNPELTPAFMWSMGDWEECHIPTTPYQHHCGPLIRTRKVHCINNHTQDHVDDKFCLDTPPPTKEDCADTSAGSCANGGRCEDGLCQCAVGFHGEHCEQVNTDRFQWHTTPYGSCNTRSKSQVCGVRWKTRGVSCVDTKDKNNKVSDRYCMQTTAQRPISQAPCDDHVVGVCQNGGQCDDQTGQCVCLSGTTGSLCEKQSPHKLDATQHCPDGKWFNPVLKSCECKEIFLTIPLRDPPYYFPPHTSGTFEQCTDEQRNYFYTLNNVFIALSKLDPAKDGTFHLIRWSTNEKGDVLNALYALRDLKCQEPTPPQQNNDGVDTTTNNTTTTNDTSQPIAPPTPHATTNATTTEPAPDATNTTTTTPPPQPPTPTPQPPTPTPQPPTPTPQPPTPTPQPPAPAPQPPPHRPPISSDDLRSPGASILIETGDYANPSFANDASDDESGGDYPVDYTIGEDGSIVATRKPKSSSIPPVEPHNFTHLMQPLAMMTTLSTPEYVDTSRTISFATNNDLHNHNNDGGQDISHLYEAARLLIDSLAGGSTSNNETTTTTASPASASDHDNGNVPPSPTTNTHSLISSIPTAHNTPNPREERFPFQMTPSADTPKSSSSTSPQPTSSILAPTSTGISDLLYDPACTDGTCHGTNANSTIQQVLRDATITPDGRQNNENAAQKKRKKDVRNWIIIGSIVGAALLIIAVLLALYFALRDRSDDEQPKEPKPVVVGGGAGKLRRRSRAPSGNNNSGGVVEMIDVEEGTAETQPVRTTRNHNLAHPGHSAREDIRHLDLA